MLKSTIIYNQLETKIIKQLKKSSHNLVFVQFMLETNRKPFKSYLNTCMSKEAASPLNGSWCHDLVAKSQISLHIKDRCSFLEVET